MHLGLFSKNKKKDSKSGNIHGVIDNVTSEIKDGINTAKIPLSTGLTILVIITLSICVLVMIWLGAHIIVLGDIMEKYRNSQGSLDGVAQVMAEIQYHYDKSYVGDKNELSFEDKALAGFTYAQGDKYGYYLSPAESKEKEDKNNERLEGIGVNIVSEDLGYYIHYIIENSPAEEAGLKIGDIIFEADGHKYEDFKDHNEFLKFIRGEVGTYVKIGVLRDGKAVYFDVEHREIHNKSVRYSILDNDTCYIKITGFTSYTDEEFKSVIETAKAEGIDDFVIDLRDNTGGVAETVIGMCDYMLPEGLIARFEYVGKSVEYTSDSSEVKGNFVILVNGMTASASELFTQSLKDYGKAVVVGEKTFGKGTVISTINLSNGGTLTMSTAKYYTISGTELEGNGVTPDYVVELSPEVKKVLYKTPLDEDEQFIKALEILNKRTGGIEA